MVDVFRIIAWQTWSVYAARRLIIECVLGTPAVMEWHHEKAHFPNRVLHFIYNFVVVASVWCVFERETPSASSWARWGNSFICVSEGFVIAQSTCGGGRDTHIAHIIRQQAEAEWNNLNMVCVLHRHRRRHYKFTVIPKQFFCWWLTASFSMTQTKWSSLLLYTFAIAWVKMLNAEIKTNIYIYLWKNGVYIYGRRFVCLVYIFCLRCGPLALLLLPKIYKNSFICRSSHEQHNPQQHQQQQ